MPISINCRCGNTISAPERLAGRTLRCPKCLGEFTVPQAAAVPPPPPIMPMLDTQPLAALGAPMDALGLEAAPPPEPLLEPESLLEPEPLLESEPTLPLTAAAHNDPLGFAAEPEMPDLDMPELESAEPPADAVETLALAEGEEMLLGDDQLAPLQENEAPVMNEEELGLFLMDEEPAEPKKKKK